MRSSARRFIVISLAVIAISAMTYAAPWSGALNLLGFGSTDTTATASPVHHSIPGSTSIMRRYYTKIA